MGNNNEKIIMENIERWWNSLTDNQKKRIVINIGHFIEEIPHPFKPPKQEGMRYG
jgi:hypothetical protein